MTTPQAAPTKPRLGFYLPSFVGAFPSYGPDKPPAAQLREVAQAGRDLGMRTAWAVDHLLHSPHLYSTTWYEPLSALAAIAGIDGLELGSGVLIAPLRQPHQAAKMVHTLSWLGARRFHLGVGAGWSADEFRLLGLDKRDRGKLLDANLATITDFYADLTAEEREIERALLGGEVNDPELVVWIAGGSQIDRPDSPEKPRIAPGVLRRIIRYGRWATRPTMTVAQARDDLAQIRQASGGTEPQRLHFNFIHIIDDTTDRDEILDRQHAAFRRVMSDVRSRESMEACYLMGTIDEIRERVAAWIDFGITDLVLHPFEDYLRQFTLWNRHLGDLVALS